MWRYIIVTIGCAVLVGACAAGDAVETESATEAAAPPAAASRVVTEADIPADINRDSWARLPLPRREQFDADGQRAYDIVRSPGSRYEDSLWARSPCGCTARA